MNNTVETLSIKGLRGFAEYAELKLAVPTDNQPGSGLTILVGPNNGGKSTITEGNYSGTGAGAQWVPVGA